MGAGCVIKSNANMYESTLNRRLNRAAEPWVPCNPLPPPRALPCGRHYATDSFSSFVVRELARRARVPVQEFVVKNDCPCGSTIGPIIAANIGVRTCDVGMPQLSMHSCREMMGTDDLTHCHALLVSFFSHFREVDELMADGAPRVADS